MDLESWMFVRVMSFISRHPQWLNTQAELVPPYHRANSSSIFLVMHFQVSYFIIHFLHLHVL